MDNNKSKLDELLHNSMQLVKDEVPEPDMAMYQSLRKHIKPKSKRSRNIFAEFFKLEVKLYQAGLAMVAVVLIFIMLRPVKTQQGGLPDASGADTSSAFKGSSLKHDTFLVKNFSTTIN